MVTCRFQMFFCDPLLAPSFCSPSKAAPRFVLAQVRPALKRAEDLLVGLVGLLKTWQVTGTNEYVSRPSEDWTCWTFDLSNLNPEERLLEQHTGPNPGSTGSLLRGRGGSADAHGTHAPAAREIKWEKEWLSQSGRMDTSEKAGVNACVIC